MKRNSLFFLVLFFYLNAAFAGDWIQKASFGGTGRHRASGCATTNKGYMGLGHVMAPEPILITMIGGNMIPLLIRGLKKQIIQLEIMPLYLLQ
jgi:hypothetical protein